MIQSYMKDEVTIVSAELDKWNQKIENETVVKAYVQFKRRWTRNAAGAAVQSEAVLAISDRDLSLQDRIKFEERTWTILSIAKMQDFSTRYLEVMVA